MAIARFDRLPKQELLTTKGSDNFFNFFFSYFKFNILTAAW